MNGFNVKKYVIELLACVFANKKATLPCGNFDWAGFRLFCEKQCISNIVAYAINDITGNIPDGIKEYFNEIIFQSMAKEARIEIEINNLMSSFENKKIKYMPLKGFVIKNFYPQPDMRSMGDVDILIGDKLNDAMDVMEFHGFELTFRANLHDNYFKKPFINVELHSSLFDKELGDMYSYFGIGFERANNQGNTFNYSLSDEDFYIYLLAHIAKHFKRTGTGVRSICDVYIFLSTHSQMNFDYINNEFRKLGLLSFAKKIEQIAFNWFNKALVNENDSIERYILSAGIYGENNNLELNKFLFNQKKFKQSKLNYFFNVVFPPLDYMSIRYPKLNKNKIFLPVYWVIRIFVTIFKRFPNIKYRLTSVLKSSKSTEDIFKYFD